MDTDALNAETPDPLRTYSAEELRRLTTNVELLSARIHRGEFSDRPFSIELLCTFHRVVFEDVREHAGRLRSRGHGSERLTFGPMALECP